MRIYTINLRAAYLADIIPLTFAGEIYLSFFNLNSQTTVISAKISDIGKVLGGEFLDNATCKCTEVWSGHKFGQVNQISMAVTRHGCALFVLECTDQFQFSKV